MQINQINTTIPKRINKEKNNPNLNNNQSFKGIGSCVDSLSLLVADAIENGGLAVSFTLQDMLGTNLPRPVMGLMRNKKENKGEKNFKFAAKEMVREFTTGPSMFIIPGAMLAAGKKLFGKATEIPMNFIKAMSNIHASNPINEAGKAITQQDFYKNAFTEIIKNAKSETNASESTLQTAKEFAQKLYENKSNKKQLSNTINELSTKFSDIVKGHAQDTAHTDFTKAVMSKNASASFKDTASHIISYADDIVEKAGKQNTDKLNTFIKNISNKKIIGRFAANIAMYAAILSFLQIIPKLYNKAEGKENAGLKGLMKEETLNDSANTDNKNKSNPSFGSSAVNKSINKAAEKLTGKNLLGKLAQAAEFEGYNMSFPLLLGVMIFGIIIPRTNQAKDKYDRTEILRRDISACAIMCFAEKALRKCFSKASEKQSGLVLASKAKGFENQSTAKKIFDYIRPIKGVNTLSTENIIAKYSNIDKYKDGIKGFCEFIEGQGGNLKKVFSLTDDSKNIVQNILSKEGKELATANNATIKQALSNAKNSEEVNKLVKLFADTNNPWVNKAKTLNARFTAFSVLLLVPVTLGFFLPWLNEKLTKKQISEEMSQKEKNTNPITNTLYFIQNQKMNNIFAEMNNFTKK